MKDNVLLMEIDKPLYETIHSVQYDRNSRFVHVKLLNNSLPFDLTNKRVILSGSKPDGEEIFNTCKIVEDLVVIEITEDMNAVPGVSEYSLEIYGGDMSLLQTKNFKIKVTPSVRSNKVESRSEVKALTDALSEVQNIDNRFAETNAQLSQVEDYTTNSFSIATEKTIVNTNKISDIDVVVKGILTSLDIKDIDYHLKKKAIGESNGYYRDFSKELKLDNTIELNGNALDGQRVISKSSFSEKGVVVKYDFENGKIKFKLKGQAFCISLKYKDEKNKLIIYNEVSAIKVAKYINGVLSVIHTLNGVSLANSDDFYSALFTKTDSTYSLKIENNNSIIFEENFERPNELVDFPNYISVGSINSQCSIYEITTVDEISESIYYQTRWFDKEIDGANHKCTINSGSELYFDVDGASKIQLFTTDIGTVDAQNKPFIAVRFDNGAYTRYRISGNSVLINTPSKGRHHVNIVISSIRYNGNKWLNEEGFALKDIVTDTGAILKAQNIENRNQIMFIGDSITEGQLMTANDMTGLQSELSYAHISAKRLGCLPLQVGFGGTGVMTGGNAGMGQTIDYIANITSTRKQNDNINNIRLIVINIGTNDANKEASSFKIWYQRTLDKVKEIYGSSIKIVIVRPFTVEVHPQQIKELAEENGCYLFEVNGNVETRDGVHPTANGHLEVSNQLVQYIITKNLI